VHGQLLTPVCLLLQCTRWTYQAAPCQPSTAHAVHSTTKGPQQLLHPRCIDCHYLMAAQHSTRPDPPTELVHCCSYGHYLMAATVQPMFFSSSSRHE
jgi:hypothetical protein